MKNLFITGVIIVCSALLLPVAGCDNGNEKAELNTPESNKWLEYLNVIPAKAETVGEVNVDTTLAVYIQDMAYLHEKQAEFPDREPYAVMRLSLAGSSGLFSHYYDMTDPVEDIPEEYRKTIGFTFDDVDQMISSGTQPYIYEAYRGRFDKAEVDNAVKTGPRYEELELVKYGGMEYYRWGEDNAANLSARTHVRPLGRGHRLAMPGDFAFWTVWDEGIETMIDCYNDTTGSLADIDEYKRMAEGLDILDAFSAAMTSDTISYDDTQAYLEMEGLPEREGHDERFNFSLNEVPLLKPYDDLATGAGLDSNGYYLAIVLVNNDISTAKRNASLLEERINKTRHIWRDELWSEMATKVTVESRDNLTLAKLYGTPSEFWSDRFLSWEAAGTGAFDPLLVHE
ncbi:MAG: hypothetical protein JW712_04970 [Dehalococcoidales bacterium]|nr:hypothetical protein [Dehalococcoidales bacterium]